MLLGLWAWNFDANSLYKFYRPWDSPIDAVWLARRRDVLIVFAADGDLFSFYYRPDSVLAWPSGACCWCRRFTVR